MDLLLHTSDSGRTLADPFGAALADELARDRADTGPQAGMRFGDYDLLEEIGRGGMGVVFRARATDGTEVALKLLRPGPLSPQLVQRFSREAHALERLHHPGIARLLDAGVTDTSRGPVPYLVTDFIAGGTLRAWAGTARERNEQLQLLARIADIVHTAHEAGVVHRDLKPENIIIDPDGAPHVLDFGVARLLDSADPGGTLTTAGVVLGTVRYMSPEQAEARPGPVDGRADVYSLGMVAAELLLGRLPYEVPEDSLHRALVAVLTSDPDFTGVDRDLRAVLRKALRKTPAERYASAAAFAAELRRVAKGERPESLNELLVAESETAQRTRPSRRPALLVASGAVAVLALLLWRPWLSARARAIAHDPERAVALDCAWIDSADTRLHDTARSRERIVEALDFLQRAQDDLAAFPARPYVADLTTYAAWREGEAHFFLGDRYGLPDEFGRAAEAWRRSVQDDRPTQSGPRLPDTTGTLMDRIRSRTSDDVAPSIGMALATLARYQRPAEHLLESLELRRRGLAAVLRRTAPGADSLNAVPFREPWGYELALNELGESWDGLANADGDSAKASIALRLLQRAAAGGQVRGIPEAHASLQHNLGNAFATRGRLVRSRADLDSAQAHLRLALQLREAVRDNVSRLETRTALADAWRSCARLDGAPHARDWLLAADTLLQGARRPGYCERSEVQTAWLDLAQARVHIDLLSLTHEPSWGASADSLLASARAVFPRSSMPVPFAMTAYESGRLQTVRWLIDGDPLTFQRASDELDLLQTAFRPDDFRSLRLRTELLITRLKHRRGEPASLEYPEKLQDGSLPYIVVP